MIDLLLMNPSIKVNELHRSSGVNAIWYAAFYGHQTIIAMLANAGADIMISNKDGYNILHIAISKNYCKIVKMLLDADFPVDIYTNEGLSPLYIAVQ